MSLNHSREASASSTRFNKPRDGSSQDEQEIEPLVDPPISSGNDQFVAPEENSEVETEKYAIEEKDEEIYLEETDNYRDNPQEESPQKVGKNQLFQKLGLDYGSSKLLRTKKDQNGSNNQALDGENTPGALRTLSHLHTPSARQVNFQPNLLQLPSPSFTPPVDPSQLSKFALKASQRGYKKDVFSDRLEKRRLKNRKRALELWAKVRRIFCFRRQQSLVERVAEGFAQKRLAAHSAQVTSLSNFLHLQSISIQPDSWLRFLISLCVLAAVCIHFFQLGFEYAFTKGNYEELDWLKWSVLAGDIIFFIHMLLEMSLYSFVGSDGILVTSKAQIFCHFFR